MHTGLMTLFMVVGAWNVWVEPSWVRVGLESGRSEHASGRVCLEAARGERESIQICVRSKKPVKGLELKVYELSDGVPAPEANLLGVVGLRGENGVQAIPDPLLPLQNVSLDPDKTLSFWVTYYVPPETKTGLHKGVIELVDADHHRERVKVRLEVLNVSIPGNPSLRAWFPMDRMAVSATSRWEPTSLAQWRPLYDLLSKDRMAWAVWDGGDLAQVAKTGSCDTTALKEHIEYIADKCRVNTISVLPPGTGSAVFPQPVRASGHDSLQVYLHDIGNWLDEKGWMSRAVVPFCVPDKRADWGNARREYLRVKRADKRFKRLLSGPLHSCFERYTEVWAFPPDDWSPFSANSLWAGRSLCEKARFAADVVEASSSGEWPPKAENADPVTRTSLTTLPADACDGSPFTAWISGRAPVQGEKEWIEVAYKDQVTTNRLAIFWKTGFECVDPRVQVSMDGRVYSAVSLRWTAHPAPGVFTDTWAEAEFKMDRTFRRLRLEFPFNSTHGPVAISEIIAGGIEGTNQQPEAAPEVEPWLQGGAHPAMALELAVEPLRYRAIPWNCRDLTVGGFAGINLTAWPESWRKPGGSASPECTVEESRGFLLYPGVDSPLHSVRMELLRDGMEDYECLKVLERLTAAGLVTKKRAVREARELLEYHAPRTLAGDGVQEEVARGIPERRKRLMAVLDKVIKRNPDWEQRIAPKKEDKEKP